MLTIPKRGAARLSFGDGSMLGASFRDAGRRPGAPSPRRRPSGFLSGSFAAPDGPRLTLGQVPLRNGANDIGLSILSIGTTMSVWSAISPSWATYRSFFSRTPEERSTALKTMLLAGGASIAMNAGLWLVFHRWLPVIAGALSTVALFAMSWMAINSEPLPQSTMEQKRQEQIRQSGPPAAAPASA